MVSKRRKSRLPASIQQDLIRHFVAGASARAVPLSLYLSRAVSVAALVAVVLVTGCEKQQEAQAPSAPPQAKVSVVTLPPRAVEIFADAGYQGPRVRDTVRKSGAWRIEIVRRPDAQKGFAVIAKRWVVERTLAWISRNRRLARDSRTWPEPQPPSSASP